MEEQVVSLWAVINGHMDEIAVEKIRDFEQKFIAHIKLREKKLLSGIAETKILIIPSPKILLLARIAYIIKKTRKKPYKGMP